MKTNFLLLAIILGCIFTISSCTDLKKDLPTPSSGLLKTHEDGWNDTTSVNFHGKVLRTKNFNLNDCVSCHAKSFEGGISGVQCFTCHILYPHKTGWNIDTSSISFHGKFLLSRQGQLQDCASCHGTAFDGGTSKKSCYNCHATYPHNIDWINSSAPAFHGKYLKVKGWQASECIACHGNSFDGGTSGKSCFTCHATYPHGTAWEDTSAAAFHGKYLKAKGWQASECTACHGNLFNGGTSEKSCYTCHSSYPHDVNWMNASSGSFHGKYLESKDWQTGECKTCHGNSFEGGTSGISCYSCHESFPHGVKFSASGGHAEYMKNNEYPLTNCQTCHGAAYNGGSIGVSCLSSGCHVNPNGPEACNTCHGNFNASSSNAFSWAPPRSVLGDTLETSPAVGAHQAHLAEGELSNLVTCNQCHKVPASVSAPGHLDSPLPAEVIFNTSLAALPSANHTFNPNPQYDRNTLRCSNAFCHGNWYLQRPKLPADTSRNFMYIDTVMSGLNYSPRWIGGQGEIECGTCHGLPPVGHKDFQTPISACYTCHYQSDIMDKSKHINGKVNIFGKERDF